MQTLSRIFASFFATILIVTSAHAGSNISKPLDANVIIKAGDLEWVWAAPCTPLYSQCNAQIVFRDGFALPTNNQWLASFSNTAALLAAFTDARGEPICGTSWFSKNWDTCDLGDLQKGIVWHAPSPIGDSKYSDEVYAETFLVRAVPEPETYAMLLLGLGLLGAVARRRYHA